jgi:DNA-binding MarR family transcriptional regulator
MTKGPQHPLGQGTHRVAQMLAQMGALAAGRFANRIAELEVTPAHAAVLRVVATEPGRSQQSLSVILGMQPARLTALLDDLETRGLIERRRHEKDHRLFALYLTAAGQQFMGRLAAAGAEHERDITGVLEDDERRQLGVILEKLAVSHGMTTGPAFGQRNTVSRLSTAPPDDRRSGPFPSDSSQSSAPAS